MAPPPPPVAVTPPPEPEAPCELRVDEDDTELDVDVSVSETADSSYKGKSGEMKEGIEARIREKHAYSAEDWGTAVAVSEGASVRASVAAGSVLSTLGGSKTARIDASEKGSTEISLYIEASEGTRTKISAAALVGLEADASVLDVPEDMYEELEIGNWIVSASESIIRLVGREEWVEKVAEVIGHGLNARQKAQLIQELNAWRKVFLAAMKDPAGAAAQGKTLIKRLYKIFRRFGGKKVFKIWELTKFLAVENVAVLIEKVGSWLLENADVEVATHGSMEFQVGECIVDNGGISVQASRHLEMKSGELEEPHDKAFERKDVRHASSACSADREMLIQLSGEAGADGSAKYDGDGYANLNSIWAVAWVAACEDTDAANKANSPRMQQTGYRWSAWFRVPDEARAKFPSDYNLADASEMRNPIQIQMGQKLDTLLSETFAGTKYCPLDNPRVTEAHLQQVLEEWYKYVQETWGLFLPQE
jgi:hypothetical protein